MRRGHALPLVPYAVLEIDRAVIPRIAHFVFGFGPGDEPFHLVHYLAIASCLEVLRPDEVHIHCHELPYGLYWDLVRPRVELHRVGPVPAVRDFAYTDPIVARYAYAHHADFVRLDVLAEWGGVYADLDTLWVAPPPDACWSAEAVIGREADVVDLATRSTRSSLSNALLMATPGARFVEAWRAQIGEALDGTWSAHSCFLAQDLATAMPDTVHVEPQRTFHPFPMTPGGFQRLFEAREPSLDGVSTIHLAAHLWWEEERRDFSAVHAGMIDEAWVRGAEVTYAVAARPFLPKHGCF